jgi:hypothetical protein
MRVVVALVLTVAVAAGASAAGVSSAPSGIRGVVDRGPIRPACEAGVPCNGPAAGVGLVFFRFGRQVGRVRTSKAGRFQLALAPGTYVVRSLRKSMLGGLAPRTVRVVSGRFTFVRLQIDTGIRAPGPPAAAIVLLPAAASREHA